MSRGGRCPRRRRSPTWRGSTDVTLPVEDPADLYEFTSLNQFLSIYDVICASLRTADDFRRITYEALEDGAAAGVRYREMFFSPGFVIRLGVPVETVWEGVQAGVLDARQDLDINCRMILDFDKPTGPAHAMEMAAFAGSVPDRDLLIGMGADSVERDIDHAAFAAAFTEAARHGLRRTIHAGEDGPAENIAIAIRQLGCERIDHGFRLLDDAGLTAEIVERQIPLDVCPTSNVMIANVVASVADHPFARQREAGVLATLNSDDPGMMRFDIADEYVAVARAFEYSLEDMEDISLAGIDACWAPDDEKQALAAIASTATSTACVTSTDYHPDPPDDDQPDEEYRPMNMHEFLKALPKVSLHVHLMGSVQARTAVDLCNKHGVPLPDYQEPEDLYDYPDIYKFLHMYDNTALAIRDREDFHRIAYETLTEAAEHNVRHREMLFNPTTHMAAGATYETCVDGLIDGIRDANTDHGIDCKLIAAVNRMETPELAVTMVETLAEHPRDEVIGIGMDYAEADFPPERFWKAYEMAADLGLHLTAHASEDAPPRNIETCLDLLGCERVDHGYHVIESDEIFNRCRDQGVVFTCTPVSTAWVYFGPDYSKHPIREMAERGLKIMLDCDDPPMFKTDPTNDYIVAADHMGFGPEDFRQFMLNGIDGSWVDEPTKRRWRREWSAEVDALIEQLDS